MRTNEFFERVVGISERQNPLVWSRFHKRCREVGLVVNKMFSLESSSLLSPVASTFSLAELGEIRDFFRIIYQASVDRISRILILKENVHFNNQYKLIEESVIDQIPREWDIIYWGYNSCQLTTEPSTRQEKEEQYIYPALEVSGCFGIAINYTFFYQFMEDTKIPLYNLEQHINKSSRGRLVYIVKPSLVYI